MSWNKEPQDLDLHTLQLDRSSRQILSHCFFAKKDCPGMFLDVDNTQVLFVFLLPIIYFALPQNIALGAQGFLDLSTLILCISTSKRVLRMPFAGRNRLSDAKTTLFESKSFVKSCVSVKKMILTLNC